MNPDTAEQYHDQTLPAEGAKTAPAFAGEGDRSAQPSGGGAASAEAEAEAGMATMSKKFREGGNELYVGAGGREHD